MINSRVQMRQGMWNTHLQNLASALTEEGRNDVSVKGVFPANRTSSLCISFFYVCSLTQGGSVFCSIRASGCFS